MAASMSGISLGTSPSTAGLIVIAMSCSPQPVARPTIQRFHTSVTRLATGAVWRDISTVLVRRDATYASMNNRPNGQRSDGFRLEWKIEFTSTPLFFIDWKECPRPAGLPRGGRITSLSVTTPEPAMLEGVAGVSVHEGTWRVEATVDDTPLS
jgi:hypothetical protein